LLVAASVGCPMQQVSVARCSNCQLLDAAIVDCSVQQLWVARCSNRMALHAVLETHSILLVSNTASCWFVKKMLIEIFPSGEMKFTLAYDLLMNP
jgi:hypothetical protein